MIAAGAVAFAPSSASAAYWKQCAGGGEIVNLRTHAFSCPKARELAVVYVKLGAPDPPATSPSAFSCRRRALGRGEFAVACRRKVNGKVQKFRFRY